MHLSGQQHRHCANHSNSQYRDIPESKAAALADLTFNVLGVLLVLPLLDPFLAVVARTSTQLPRQIANAHTLFNLGTAGNRTSLNPLSCGICLGFGQESLGEGRNTRKTLGSRWDV